MAWNRPTSNTGNAASSSRPSGRGKMPRLRRGLLAGAIVVLGAGLAAWLLMSGEADSRPLLKKERGRIKEVTPVPAPKVVATNAVPTKPKTLKERCKERFGDDRLLPGRLALLSSCKEGIDLRPIVESNKVGEVRLSRYSNPLHQELAQYVHPGQSCGTPDPIDDALARKLAREEVKYDFNDPIEVLEEKKAVQDLVNEMMAYMDKGGHAQQFLMELMERQDAEYETMKTVRNNITELCKEGDIEMAQKAFEKYNAYLREKGLPAVQPTGIMEYYLRKGENK